MSDLVIDPNKTPNCPKKETFGKSFTLYLDIKLGVGGSQAWTAVHVPDGNLNRSLPDVILYFHGINITSIFSYLKDPRWPLQKELDAATKNSFIFVAPTLTTGSTLPALTKSSDNTAAFLQQVFNGLVKHGGFTETPTWSRIILAAHSGGGKVMREIAKLGSIKQDIHEIWGFDCMYGEKSTPPGQDDIPSDGPEWINWLKTGGHRLDKFVHYYTPYRKTYGKGGTKPQGDKTKPGYNPVTMSEKGGPTNNSDYMRDAAAKEKLPNVFVEQTSVAHDLVPKTYLKKLVNESPTLV